MLQFKTWILVVLIVKLLQCGASYFAGFALENLALNLEPLQSTNSSCPLYQSVNGNLDDFSCTLPETYNWWFVNFKSLKKVAVIKVYSQAGFGNSTKKVAIKTAVGTSPYYPQKENHRWTTAVALQRFTHKLVKVYSPCRALIKFIAVTSEVQTPLKINEVEVYGFTDTHNVARGKSASHSSDANQEKALAHEAVNGMFDDFASPATGEDSYWMLNLNATYTIETIRIHNGANYSSISNPTVIIGVLFKRLNNDIWSTLKVITKDFRIEEISAKRDIGKLALKNVDIRTHMRLAEVEMFVERNLALCKPTSASSADKESEKAVNGYNSDYITVSNSGLKWWGVDLVEVYSVGHIKIGHRSEDYNQWHNFTLNSAKVAQLWTLRNRNSRKNGKFETITITSPREMHHINITLNKTDGSLEFTEVIVHEYNFALEHTSASQSSALSNNISQFGAGKAVDNSMRTYAITNYYANDEEWWSLQLSKLIKMTSVEIFHYKGSYKQSEDQQRTKKGDYYTAVQIKTSRHSMPPTVSLNSDDNWTLCVNQTVEFPVRVQHLECERNLRRPFTKHLSIQPIQKKDRLALEEVAIYGRELAQFPPDAIAHLVSKNYTSFELLFSIWNSTLIGDYAPEQYVVKLNDTGASQIYKHKNFTNVGQIIAAFTNLQIDTAYSYTITCHLKSVPCPGKVITGVVRTIACLAPERPAFKRSIIDQKSSLQMNVNINKTDINCVSEKEFRVVLETGDSIAYNHTGRRHVINYLKHNTIYKLIVSVTNIANFTNMAYEDGIFVEGVPDKPVLISAKYNTSCIHLRVANPSSYQYSMLNFKFFCIYDTKLKEKTVNGLEVKEAAEVFCEFSPGTKVLCGVYLKNNLGKSDNLVVQGNTKGTKTTSTTASTTQPTTTVTEAPSRKTGWTVALPITGGILILILAALVVKVYILPSVHAKPNKVLS